MCDSAQVLLGLHEQFGSEVLAEAVMQHFQQLDMGFELVNITVRSHRILSLIASLLIGVVFAFGSPLMQSLMA